MTEDELYADMEPLVKSLGLILVDCRMQQTRHGVAVQLVIHRAEGIGTDSCAQVHRMAMPRLEVLYDNRDIRLEVTSPGLERKIRMNREYQIFLGRGVRITCKDSREYHGVLKAVSASGCTILTDGKDVVLSFDTIARTKLEYTEEGGESWA